VRVRVGELVVEVDAAFDPATLQRVLAVVATC
jgi:acetolactate synthase regulatory subunit